MEDKLVTVADFTDHIAANAAKFQLEAEGIKAVVVGENLMGAYPTYGTMQIEVQVMEKDLNRARAVLKDFEWDSGEDDEDSGEDDEDLGEDDQDLGEDDEEFGEDDQDLTEEDGEYE